MSNLEISLEHKNVQAFLEMIRHSEGTAGADGYRMLFGGTLFGIEHDNSGNEVWPDHPHIFFKYKNKAGEVVNTSAAGAYQITYTTWNGLKRHLGLADFSPRNQDMAAVSLINDAGALTLLLTGYFDEAIEKVRKIWASLPGSGCNQPEHSLADVKKWYEDAGGTV